MKTPYDTLTTDESRLAHIHTCYSEGPIGYYTDKYNAVLRDYYGEELFEEYNDSEIASWFIIEWEG